MTTTAKNRNSIHHNIQTLLVYLYYRVALSGVLFTMFLLDITPNILGANSEKLYFYTSLAYFIAAIISPLVFNASSLRHSQKRLHLLLITDICAQFILIHACDGVESGLGYLLIISIAMTSIFFRGQTAYTYAALTSILLILDNIYLHQRADSFTKVMFSTGVLGILLFATTVSLQYLTEKIRLTTKEAEEQARHIQNLQEIAQNIVTRMQTGVIVVDNELKIELMNTSAKQMLDIHIDNNVYGKYLADYRELAPVLKSWDDIAAKVESTIVGVKPGYEIRVNVAHLETGGLPKNIFYLEDYTSIKQYAQQLKLASLGGLAARIAHEIRNPLGALSHASQLLAESNTLNATDKRMTEIIESNCRRVDEIIENTLAISRRKEPNPVLIDLVNWLPAFLNDSHPKQAQYIHLDIKTKKLQIRFDTTHLQQILSNLIDNGLRYSEEKNGVPWVKLQAGLQLDDTRPYLEVIDNGKGISKDTASEIYEPFYTTNEKGSGLGLYVCKELTEINHATLHYRKNDSGQSCFRVNFSHHQRVR